MRILFVAWRDLANDLAGGSEVLVDQLAAGLTRRGHDVTLLCANPISGPRDYEVRPNGGTVDQYLRAPFAYLRHFRDADLVVDVANGLAFYASTWRRGPSVCFVNHIHTEQWAQWFPAPLAAVGRTLEHHAMPAAYRNRLFVAVSPSTADSLVALGVPRDSIRIIINGTTLPDRPGTESPDPLFACLGRLVPHKRFDLAIDAFRSIHPEIGGRLVIAGKGPELERLRATAGPGVEVPGRIADDARDDLLSSAWLLVHPASHEGWGLVITEAAGHGTPSLAFRVPGLRDSVVDGMSGILVDHPDDLAETWRRLALDPALRSRLRDGARRRAAACTWDSTVDRFEEICEEAVQDHRRPGRSPRGSWSAHRPDPSANAATDRPPEQRGLPIGTGRPILAVPEHRPDLSIVIPAFNEAARLPVSLPVLLDHLTGSGRSTEIIVVDDGSTDHTVEVAETLLELVDRAGVLRLHRHTGKGGAIRAGVARSAGELVAFLDADMATDLADLDMLLAALERAPVAIGSRSAPGAITSGLTPSSDATHRAFNHLARRITRLPIADFQCGAKAFRGDVGRLLFHLVEEDGYAFDVELLTLAADIGYRISELPVRWHAVRGSHMRILADSAAMAGQLLRIEHRRRRGRPLAALHVHGRDPDTDLRGLAIDLQHHLPATSPIVPWEDGALALLPFVGATDAAALAGSLAERRRDLLVRSTLLEADALFDPTRHRLRAALAAS